MKPKHQGGYTPDHTVLCERTLVTLLRGLGPWKRGIYIVGGLAPRYLIPQTSDPEELPPHIGTTDVDLVLNLAILAEVEAYRRLEKNLKTLGFERGKNDEDAPQHFRWLKPAGQEITIIVTPGLCRNAGYRHCVREYSTASFSRAKSIPEIALRLQADFSSRHRFSGHESPSLRR